MTLGLDAEVLESKKKMDLTNRSRFPRIAFSDKFPAVGAPCRAARHQRGRSMRDDRRGRQCQHAQDAAHRLGRAGLRSARSASSRPAGPRLSAMTHEPSILINASLVQDSELIL
jgi:hypothetical protein